jgi:hypothetical protein
MATRQCVARPAALASMIKQRHIEGPILALPALIIEDGIELGWSRPHRQFRYDTEGSRRRFHLDRERRHRPPGSTPSRASSAPSRAAGSDAELSIP